MLLNDLIVEQAGKILTIQLNRPAKKNALTQAMYLGMIHALESADADDSIHCVYLRGTAECFCAGNDLKDFLETGAQAAAEFVKCISRVKKPIVAAVNGPAVGVGTTMLLHCDLVVAAEDAYFMMPFTDLGLCPEAGASYLLPRMLGYSRASELLLLGARIDAAKACELGLINRVCAAEQYISAGWELAEVLAAKPLAAILATKALIRKHQAPLVEQAIDNENEQFASLLASDESRQIMAAFFLEGENSGDLYR